jgi:hypothetical protein
MAKFTLPVAGPARLPRRCIVCGSDDCSLRKVTIKPNASEGNMLAMMRTDGYYILHLSLPLCEEHKSHFAFQTWLRYVAIAVILVVTSIGAVIAMSLRNPVLLLIPVVSAIGLGFGWLFLSARLNRDRVHVSALDDASVTFSNVSPEFARALEDKKSPRAETTIRAGGEESSGTTAGKRLAVIGGVVAAVVVVCGLLILLGLQSQPENKKPKGKVIPKDKITIPLPR